MGTTLPCFGRHWGEKSKQNEGQHHGCAHRHLASRQRPEVNSQKPCAEGEHPLPQIVLLHLRRDEPLTLGWTLLHQLARQKMPTDTATSQSDGGNSSCVVPLPVKLTTRTMTALMKSPFTERRKGEEQRWKPERDESGRAEASGWAAKMQLGLPWTLLRGVHCDNSPGQGGSVQVSFPALVCG